MACPRRPSQIWDSNWGLSAHCWLIPLHTRLLKNSQDWMHSRPQNISQKGTLVAFEFPALWSIHRPTAIWNSLESPEQVSMLACLYVVSWICNPEECVRRQRMWNGPACAGPAWPPAPDLAMEFVGPRAKWKYWALLQQAVKEVSLMELKDKTFPFLLQSLAWLVKVLSYLPSKKN